MTSDPEMKGCRIIFVTGPSGVGKSTLAALLAKKIRYQQMSLDKVREHYCGDTRKAWFEIWRSIKSGKKLVIDTTGASRIFRLIYRAAVFKHADPLIVRLSLRRKRPPRVSDEKKMQYIRLSNGKQVTERYLIEGSSSSTTPDLEIDATTLTPRQVVEAVLEYLHGCR